MAAQFDDDFRFLKDTELLALIAKAKESKRAEVVARAAWNEFRRRYRKYVDRFVRSARSRFLCPGRDEAVIDDVFETVWEQACSFSHHPANNERAEHHRICIWLGSPICHHLIKRLNDKELLVCAARRDEGEYELSVADRAFAEFVRRHKKQLRWRCAQFAWGILSEMEVEELVQDTFTHVWLKAHTYKDGGISDRTKLHGRTTGWLNAMAYHLFIDRLRDRRDVETVAYDDEEALDYHKWCKTWHQFFSSDASGGDDDDEKRLAALEERAVEFTREALLTVLSDAQRVILQTNEQDFPDDKAKLAAFRAVEANLRITPVNRRQQLKRAIEKVQKHVQKRMEEYLRENGPPDADDDDE